MLFSSRSRGSFTEEQSLGVKKLNCKHIKDMSTLYTGMSKAVEAPQLNVGIGKEGFWLAHSDPNNPNAGTLTDHLMMIDARLAETRHEKITSLEHAQCDDNGKLKAPNDIFYFSNSLPLFQNSGNFGAFLYATFLYMNLSQCFPSFMTF